MACVYQTQAQAMKRSEIAANSETARSSKYVVVPSVDSAITSPPNPSPSTAHQGTLDTVSPFYSVL